MRRKTRLFFLFLLFVFIFPLISAEYSNGAIRLVLDEANGRFSLYYLPAGSSEKPEPLFSDSDPRTSFLSVIVNDRSYKMGNSSQFRMRLAGEPHNPSLIFESSFLSVTQGFSFISIPSTAAANGIRISITLENISDREVSAGARFLLDTHLGEKAPVTAISTNLRTLNSETLISSRDSDSFWIDRSRKVSLTGSLNTRLSGDPDSVHFANWKKLSDVTWKANFQSGRNFTNPPYSVNDTSVCYYFDPRPLGRGEKRSFAFTLLGSEYASEIQNALNQAHTVITAAPQSGGDRISDLDGAATPNQKDQDLAELRELTARINAHLFSGTVTDEELAAIEFSLNKLRARYGPDTERQR